MRVQWKKMTKKPKISLLAVLFACAKRIFREEKTGEIFAVYPPHTQNNHRPRPHDERKTRFFERKKERSWPRKNEEEKGGRMMGPSFFTTTSTHNKIDNFEQNKKDHTKMQLGILLFAKNFALQQYD
jgi:hypothetical protein